MANIYELGINRGIVEELAKDMRLSLGSGAEGNIVDNLMGIVDQPTTFQKVSTDGKPGFCVRVGQIRTDRFEGQGLHVFAHSGSEGFLDILEFDRRLKSSLARQGIIYQDRT
jgi:hypothetical protein